MAVLAFVRAVRAARPRRVLPRDERWPAGRARAGEAAEPARPRRRRSRCSWPRSCVLGVAVPAAVIADRQGPRLDPGGGLEQLTALQQQGRELFGQRCRSCHTLKAANAIGERRAEPRPAPPRTRRSCSTRSRTAARAATARCPPQLSRARTPRPSPSSWPSRRAAPSTTPSRAARKSRPSSAPAPFFPLSPGTSRLLVFGSAGASATMLCGPSRWRSVTRGRSLWKPLLAGLFLTATVPGRIR